MTLGSQSAINDCLGGKFKRPALPTDTISHLPPSRSALCQFCGSPCALRFDKLTVGSHLLRLLIQLLSYEIIYTLHVDRLLIKRRGKIIRTWIGSHLLKLFQ